MKLTLRCLILFTYFFIKTSFAFSQNQSCFLSPIVITDTLEQYLPNYHGCIGASVLLKLVTNVGNNVSYQWKFNGVDIPNEINQRMNAFQYGIYSLTVRNITQNCSVTSNGIIFYNGFQHRISSQENTTIACSGDTIQLFGERGVHYVYQWVKDGVNIPNANQRMYKATSSGTYSLKITLTGCNFYNVTSNNSIAMTFDDRYGLEPNISSYDNIYSDCNNKSIVLKSNKLPSNYTFQWYKNEVAIPNSIRDSLVVTETGSYRIQVTKPSTFCYGWSSRKEVKISNIGINRPIIQAKITEACSGNLIKLETDRKDGILTWLKNGVEISNSLSPSIIVSETGIYSVKYKFNEDCFNQSDALAVNINSNISMKVIGDMIVTPNEPTFEGVLINGIAPLFYSMQEWYNNSLVVQNEKHTVWGGIGLVNTNYRTPTSVGNGCGVGTFSGRYTQRAGTCSPNIYAFESDGGKTKVCLGANKTISINIGTNGTGTFQWLKEGIIISGATQSSYTINNFSYNDVGLYSAIITNNCGYRVSRSIMLDIEYNEIVLPTLLASPQLGGNISFVTKSGTISNNLLFSWSGPNGFSSTQRNPIISNANPLLHNGEYVVNVKNPVSNCINSAKLNLSVLCPPETAISSQSGLWNSPNTWLCQQQPSILSEVKIDNNHTIIIPQNLQVQIKKLSLFGSIFYQTNSSLKISN